MEDEEVGNLDMEAQQFRAAVQEDSSNDIYKEMTIRGLKSIYIRSNKEYELFRTMVNALSYDQEKLSDEYAKYFKKKLLV